MENLEAVELPYPECDAKNLFVRDDKKRNYYLISLIGAKRVNLKEFRKQHGLRALFFASAEDLLDIMKLTPGSVSPLGLLNDSECRFQFFMDSDFQGNRIRVHPNDNTATIWLQSEELMHLIKEHGNKMSFTTI